VVQTRAEKRDIQEMAAGGVRVLVISQHDAVRRQLVAYLHRSPALIVSGDEFSGEAIRRQQPEVLVLDLSALGRGRLEKALDAARGVGARVIALASLHDPAAERTVVAAGGRYRLKSAGADGLTEAILAPSSA
jgi:DNA-binding NarL/FixJ family response regulator